MSGTSVLRKLNPAVPSHWLLLLAGFLWMAVGVFLCLRAFVWLEEVNGTSEIIFGASGAVVAVVGNRFMFANVAHKNVGRIFLLPQRACVFAFTAWKGYAMIVVMVALGITVRNSSFPKRYLAPIYIAMGGALFLSSFVFYQSFWQRFRTHQPSNSREPSSST